MKGNNYAYYMQSESAAKFGYPICAMGTGYLYIFKEQSKPGHVILAYKDHVNEMTDISDGEQDAFLVDITEVAKAIHKIHRPDKVNYGAYDDTGCHLHMHIVPKYNGGDEWGGTFQMNLDKVYLTNDEYEATAEQIRAALQGPGE